MKRRGESQISQKHLMGFRVTLALAAAVLPRAAALRPKIRGGRILEAAADACPADDCCPAKLEPIPASDDDTDERPAAAVSRALEKLDDEEEPPAYDFTPDKAKPAKHRSSVEVDELWPAAGVAGAGAAAAANESKAADGDMDCDSDSDLGSRISLHAPM